MARRGRVGGDSRVTRLVTAAALAALVVLAASGTAGAAAADRPAAARASLWRAGQPSLRQASALYVPGELLVEYRAGLGASARAKVARAYGARVVRALPASAAAPGRRLVLVRSGDVSTAELRRLFAADSAVARVSPNYIRRVATAVPDDPGLVDQRGLLRVNAPDAWEVTTGSPDVVVARIDTGVDLLHPDLAANVWRNPGEVAGNGLDDDANGYIDDVHGIDAAYDDSSPMDDYGHGTHTSGIMAAATGDGTGIAGVAPGVRVMAVKFLDRDGSGTDADALESIDYVLHERLDHGVNVVAVNASWGGGGSDLFLRNAIAALGDAGIVFVASAGNDDEDNDSWPSYPAAFDCTSIIAVAATNKSDKLSWFSNYGDCSVDIGAPGSAVLSDIPDGCYAVHDGTSMAAPFVTGAVALCASEYPAETAVQRVRRICDSARPLEALEKRCTSGGCLDVAAALGRGAVEGDATAPVTTLLGADTEAHDVRVTLSLFAGDGGGSGVAATEWRLDGGAWKTGTSAIVPAPAGTSAVRLLEYRSTDRAGNVEATGSWPVTVDTTGPDDGRLPGVRLPASPIVGGISDRTDPRDIYKVRLNAGESLTVRETGRPGADLKVWLYRPGVDALWRSGSVARIDTVLGRTLAFRATRAGTYSLAVMGWRGPYNVPDRYRSRLSAIGVPYRLEYAVHPPGVDVIPRRSWSRAAGGTGRTWPRP
jgi:subtilisin family serine protease